MVGHLRRFQNPSYVVYCHATLPRPPPEGTTLYSSTHTCLACGSCVPDGSTGDSQ